MIKVLFLCLGNICRSPMAEATFREHVTQSNLQHKIFADSAGTASWHVGKVPHEGTRDILDKYNISYVGMKARQVNASDGATFDYIVAMDDQNIVDLKQILHDGHNSEVVKLIDFVTDSADDHVPDPYYTGDFNYTYELVNVGTKNILDYIINKHHIN